MDLYRIRTNLIWRRVGPSSHVVSRSNALKSTLCPRWRVLKPPGQWRQAIILWTTASKLEKRAAVNAPPLLPITPPPHRLSLSPCFSLSFKRYQERIGEKGKDLDGVHSPLSPPLLLCPLYLHGDEDIASVPRPREAGLEASHTLRHFQLREASAQQWTGTHSSDGVRSLLFPPLIPVLGFFIDLFFYLFSSSF